MSRIRYPKRSRSSHGRNRDIQKEPHDFCVNTTAVTEYNTLMGETQGQACCHGNPGGMHHTNSCMTVNDVLEQIITKTAPHLWEKELIKIFNLYDDKNYRNRIDAWRKSIEFLQQRLNKDVDPPMIRMLVVKTRNKYQKMLDEFVNPSTSTPPCSDDEDSDYEDADKPFAQCSDTESTKPPVSHTTYNEKQKYSLSPEMFKYPITSSRKPIKVDDTNSVETPKNFEKIKKADKVTFEVDKAPYITTRKNLKTLKNHKASEDAGPRRCYEAQQRISRKFHEEDDEGGRREMVAQLSEEEMKCSSKDEIFQKKAKTMHFPIVNVNPKASVFPAGELTSSLVFSQGAKFTANAGICAPRAVSLCTEKSKDAVLGTMRDYRLLLSTSPEEPTQPTQNEAYSFQAVETLGSTTLEAVESRSNQTPKPNLNPPATDQTPSLNKASLTYIGYLKGGARKKKNDESPSHKPVGIEIRGARKRKKDESPSHKPVGKESRAQNSLNGLENLTNTCYMNSAIQCLHACKRLREVTSKQRELSEGDTVSKAMTETYREQLIGISKPTKLFKAICTIKECEHYANKEQQDVSALLGNLIGHWSDNNKDLSNLFTGGYVSTIKCMNCMDESDSWENFTELSLPLNGSSIEEMIANLQNHEILDKDNLWKCDKCGTKTLAAKSLRISACPDILLVQIKRFLWLDYYNEPIKLNKHVQFAKNLIVQERKTMKNTVQTEDSAQRTIKNVRYTLKGIVRHKGAAISSGHYYAVTLDTNGENWTLYDDESSEKKYWSWLKNQQAYMLFYEKDDTRQTEKDGTILSKNLETPKIKTKSDMMGHTNRSNHPNIMENPNIMETTEARWAKLDSKVAGGSAKQWPNKIRTFMENSAKGISQKITMRKETANINKEITNLSIENCSETGSNNKAISKKRNILKDGDENDVIGLRKLPTRDEPSAKRTRRTIEKMETDEPIENDRRYKRGRSDQAVASEVTKRQKQVPEISDKMDIDRASSEKCQDRSKISTVKENKHERKISTVKENKHEQQNSPLRLDAENHGSRKDNKIATEAKEPEPNFSIQPATKRSIPVFEVRKAKDTSSETKRPTGNERAKEKKCSVAKNPGNGDTPIHEEEKRMTNLRQILTKELTQAVLENVGEVLKTAFDEIEKLKQEVKYLRTLAARRAQSMGKILSKKLSESDEEDLVNAWEQQELKSPTPASLQCQVHNNCNTKNSNQMDIDTDESITGTERPNWEIKKKAQNIEGKLWTIEEKKKTDKNWKRKMNTPKLNYNKALEREENINHDDYAKDVGESGIRGHFSFLKECYSEHIGLPLQTPQRKRIYSYKNVCVAKGYERILVTWQGMFYEIRDEDIQFQNLEEKLKTSRGEEKWATEGVTAYRWESNYNHVLKPHRFSVLPREASNINWGIFNPHRWYIHVYQTKIESRPTAYRTIHSRWVAKQLDARCGKSYFPREIDFKWLNRTTHSNLALNHLDSNHIRIEQERQSTNNVSSNRNCKKKEHREETASEENYRMTRWQEQDNDHRSQTCSNNANSNAERCTTRHNHHWPMDNRLNDPRYSRLRDNRSFEDDRSAGNTRTHRFQEHHTPKIIRSEDKYTERPNARRYEERRKRSLEPITTYNQQNVEISNPKWFGAEDTPRERNNRNEMGRTRTFRRNLKSNILSRISTTLSSRWDTRNSADIPYKSKRSPTNMLKIPRKPYTDPNIPQASSISTESHKLEQLREAIEKMAREVDLLKKSQSL